MGLRSIIMVRNLDIYCLQDHCLSNNTASKMQIQNITGKDFSYFEKPKTKNPKSVPSHNNIAKLTKKENKQKKLKYWYKTVNLIL